MPINCNNSYSFNIAVIFAIYIIVSVSSRHNYCYRFNCSIKNYYCKMIDLTVVVTALVVQLIIPILGESFIRPSCCCD